MDKFLVIRNHSVIVDTFVSEKAAKDHIYELVSKPGADHNTYQVAQLVATCKTVRVWNHP